MSQIQIETWGGVVLLFREKTPYLFTLNCVGFRVLAHALQKKKEIGLEHNRDNVIPIFYIFKARALKFGKNGLSVVWVRVQE